MEKKNILEPVSDIRFALFVPVFCCLNKLVYTRVLNIQILVITIHL